MVQESAAGPESDDATCIPGVMPLDLAPPSGIVPILVGEVFMRHFFTVFTRGDGTPGSARVGFAPAKLGASPLAGAPAGAAVLADAAHGRRARNRASGEVA